MDKNKEIIERLRKEYGDTESALDYENPYELLVATILAAQCTDVRVNIVTKELFKKYPSPRELAQADLAELEGYIKTCGLYKNKAKNLIACAQRLMEEFGGVVPHTEEELTSLAGVGRKTANVVLAFAFGLPAFPVDTHVKRVSNRIGFAHSDDPNKVEEEDKKIIRKEDWSQAHHWLIWHGRKVCKAQKPLCDICCISDLCPYNNK
ncbi:MAG: endonuclease III [Christensenella sp.]|uniref:endonuclease III n=1 Tax=Christensenella sp. TaxID=1935934 RepID=UPI002B205071|nr:endonuclease III [Christensenella sp.]MEA5002459.1 endonuclease III [Christensenella sp.]